MRCFLELAGEEEGADLARARRRTRAGREEVVSRAKAAAGQEVRGPQEVVVVVAAEEAWPISSLACSVTGINLGTLKRFERNYHSNWG